ncbi:MAG: hypothetical protein JWM05_1285 [Acidimicrobiales bacterium]|nr:hypothetical protein [Acidimicrobiales bacterium]
MHAASLAMDLRLPLPHSLKAKRSVITPILEGARRRYRVASSEVAHQDSWQRTQLGFAAVGPTEGQVRDILDEVERFVWSFPEVEIIAAHRRWMEDD